MQLIFWLFLKEALREVAVFDNSASFQVKIKAKLVSVWFYYSGIFTVNSYKILITLGIGNFMSIQAFTEFNFVKMTETNLFSSVCFCSLFLAVYGVF